MFQSYLKHKGGVQVLKKFVVSVLTIAMLAFGAGPVLGAPDAAKLQELQSLHQQMHDLQIQIIDKRVESGILEKEKAEKIKEKIDQHHQKVQEDMANGKYDFGKKHKRDDDSKEPQATPDTKPSPSTN